MPLALKKLEAGTVSIFMNLQPIVASIVAIGIGQDTFTWEKSLSALLVLSGVFLLSTSQSKKSEQLCKGNVNQRPLAGESI